VERSLVIAVLVVSALLTAAFLLVRAGLEGSGLVLAAGGAAGLAGIAGLVLVARAVALDARRGVRR
jgi:hypothetical protein